MQELTVTRARSLRVEDATLLRATGQVRRAVFTRVWLHSSTGSNYIPLRGIVDSISLVEALILHAA